MATIILDIDGVLSPSSDDPALLPSGFSLHSYGEAKAYLNPSLHLDWIENIATNSNFVWGSKREEYSNLIFKMLGLNIERPWIPIDGSDVGLGTWKLKTIKKWVSENLKDDELLIWVEDELEPDAYVWAKNRGNTILVCPHLEVGLTSSDLSLILASIKAGS